MKNLDRLKIIGGSRLHGEVTINGAKNSALAIMAGTILASEELILDNVPQLADVSIMVEVLRSLGVKIQALGSHQLHIDAREIMHSEAPYELVTKMRASFFVLGPLLARLGEARIPLPGGCAIGSRPVDIHLKGLEALGAQIELEHGNVIARADRLVGAHIYLDYPSVGATENIMMAACLAEGETIIDNAAQEPEIEDLAEFLTAMGALVQGAGTDRIIIQGVPVMNRPARHSIMADRIEAGTFMIAAAMTGGNILLEKIPPKGLDALVHKMRKVGVQLDILPENRLRVQAAPDSLLSTDVRTLPFPGFPTDLQAQFVAMMTIAQGTSLITETVFENRFLYVDELLRMGANIRLEGNTAIVKGRSQLSGAMVQSTDLRAAAALVLAGLVAEGETSVSNLCYLDRGYEHFEQKLAQLGAQIWRIAIKAEKAENVLVNS